MGLPLYTVQMDKLVTKFMGETSVKLRQNFDSVENATGVCFLMNLMLLVRIEI